MTTTLSSAGRLPVEVMSMAMDWLDVAELLLLSRVCVQWRAIAHAHPHYWRDVYLASDSVTALEFFQARLNGSAALDVRIYVQLSDAPLSGQMRTILFPALARNLCRAAHLRLNVHADAASHAMLALNCPSPRLCLFSLGIFNTPQHAILHLSPNIFAYSCPLLRSVELFNVQLPTQPVLALEGVESLKSFFDEPFTFSTHLFAHFAALRVLVLCGQHCADVISEAYPTAVSIPLLRRLEVYVGIRMNYDRLWAAMPNLRAIKSVVCAAPPREIASLLLSHLEGPMRLEFSRVSLRHIHMALSTPSGGHRERTFAQPEAYMQGVWPECIRLPPLFLERITALALPSQIAYLASQLDVLPCCATLEVLDATGRLIPEILPSGPFRLPALNTAIVRAHQDDLMHPVTVRGDELEHFLSLLIGRRDKTLRLELHGISLSGDVESLFRAFRWPQ